MVRLSEHMTFQLGLFLTYCLLFALVPVYTIVMNAQ